MFKCLFNISFVFIPQIPQYRMCQTDLSSFPIDLFFHLCYFRCRHPINPYSSTWLFSFMVISQVNPTVTTNLECVQAYHRDTADLVSDHHHKANITIKRVTHIIGFPMHTKVMFMLYCSLLSVQIALRLKKNVST